MTTNQFPPSPLFRDPIFDGATDPTIIYNQEEACYWMLYTQRRSSSINIGVSHIHGTLIGIASSNNLIDWVYRGTLPNLEFEPGTNTFWAPEVIYVDGTYHMYVSYVPGVPTNWNCNRYILHYTATNLWEFTFISKLNLSSDRGTFKMWYKDEVHNSYSYSALSKNLYDWEVVGPEITDVSHEGPNVFTLCERNFMITDFWSGLGVYESNDFTNWVRKADILNTPGTRNQDQQIAHHADVVVSNNKKEAFIFYFVHPDYNPSQKPKSFEMTYKEARTVIQVAKITAGPEGLICNRNESFSLSLS